jgi:hypothetical protein
MKGHTAGAAGGAQRAKQGRRGSWRPALGSAAHQGDAGNQATGGGHWQIVQRWLEQTVSRLEGHSGPRRQQQEEAGGGGTHLSAVSNACAAAAVAAAAPPLARGLT